MKKVVDYSNCAGVKEQLYDELNACLKELAEALVHLLDMVDEPIYKSYDPGLTVLYFSLVSYVDLFRTKCNAIVTGNDPLQKAPFD